MVVTVHHTLCTINTPASIDKNSPLPLLAGV